MMLFQSMSNLQLRLDCSEYFLCLIFELLNLLEVLRFFSYVTTS